MQEEQQFDDFEQATYASITHQSDPLSLTIPTQQTTNLNEGQPITNTVFSSLQTSPNPIDSINFQFTLQAKSQHTELQPIEIKSLQKSIQTPLAFDFGYKPQVKQQGIHSQQAQLFEQMTSSINPDHREPLPVEQEYKPSDPTQLNENFFLGLQLQGNQGEIKDNIEFAQKKQLFQWQTTNQTNNPIANIQANFGLLLETSATVTNPTRPQVNNEGDPFSLMQMNQSQPQGINKPFILSTNTMPINVNQIQKDERKQSQEFVFGEQAREQERKNSQQFVFQQQVQEPQKKVEQLQQNKMAFTILNQTQQPNQEQILPAQEEDDFGDFQETTVVNEVQVQTKEALQEGSLKQDNTVFLKQDYSKSNQSEFYEGKKRELQLFVDSLPDYGFLFRKAFIV